MHFRQLRYSRQSCLGQTDKRYPSIMFVLITLPKSFGHFHIDHLRLRPAIRFRQTSPSLSGRSGADLFGCTLTIPPICLDYRYYVATFFRQFGIDLVRQKVSRCTLLSQASDYAIVDYQCATTQFAAIDSLWLRHRSTAGLSLGMSVDGKNSRTRLI